MSNKLALPLLAATITIIVAVISVADEAGASSISTRDSNGSECPDNAPDDVHTGPVTMAELIAGRYSLRIALFRHVEKMKARLRELTPAS